MTATHTDPRLTDWQSGSPARMIAALGFPTDVPDEHRDKLTAWHIALVKAEGIRDASLLRNYLETGIRSWATDNGKVPMADRAALLVCIFGNPFSGEPLIRETWRSSSVVDLAREIAGGLVTKCPANCRSVNNSDGGYVYVSAGPESHWEKCEQCKGAGKISLPDYSRTPILADALMDAGCDDELILSHLRGTVHCPGCLIVTEIAGVG